MPASPAGLEPGHSQSKEIPAGTDETVVRPSVGTRRDRQLLAALVNSWIFAEYRRAYAKATGLPVALRPVESWHLLLNEHLRVSEIAYEVGFQSLTHFNRRFKKNCGESPTQYRARLAAQRKPASHHRLAVPPVLPKEGK